MGYIDWQVVFGCKDYCGSIAPPMLESKVMNKHTVWHDITTGLQLNRAKALRGLGFFLLKDRPEHHSFDFLKGRGVVKGSSWQFTFGSQKFWNQPDLSYLCLLLLVEHRPSTTPRHRTLFWAALVILDQLVPCCFSSASVSHLPTVARLASLALPLWVPGQGLACGAGC